MKEETINVQLEVQKILGQFGTTEMAIYRMQKLCEVYAKDQIEKDRERVKEEFNEDPFVSIEKVLQSTPIILD